MPPSEGQAGAAEPAPPADGADAPSAGDAAESRGGGEWDRESTLASPNKRVSFRGILSTVSMTVDPADLTVRSEQAEFPTESAAPAPAGAPPAAGAGAPTPASEEPEPQSARLEPPAAGVSPFDLGDPPPVPTAPTGGTAPADLARHALQVLPRGWRDLPADVLLDRLAASLGKEVGEAAPALEAALAVAAAATPAPPPAAPARTPAPAPSPALSPPSRLPAKPAEPRQQQQQQRERSVEFTDTDGDLVRFMTFADGTVFLSVNGDKVGELSELEYDGASGMVWAAGLGGAQLRPRDRERVVPRLRALADAAGLPHNLPIVVTGDSASDSSVGSGRAATQALSPPRSQQTPQLPTPPPTLRHRARRVSVDPPGATATAVRAEDLCAAAEPPRRGARARRRALLAVAAACRLLRLLRRPRRAPARPPPRRTARAQWAPGGALRAVVAVHGVADEAGCAARLRDKLYCAGYDTSVLAGAAATRAGLLRSLDGLARATGAGDAALVVCVGRPMIPPTDAGTGCGFATVAVQGSSVEGISPAEFRCAAQQLPPGAQLVFVSDLGVGPAAGGAASCCVAGLPPQLLAGRSDALARGPPCAACEQPLATLSGIAATMSGAPGALAIAVLDAATRPPPGASVGGLLMAVRGALRCRHASAEVAFLSSHPVEPGGGAHSLLRLRSLQTPQGDPGRAEPGAPLPQVAELDARLAAAGQPSASPSLESASLPGTETSTPALSAGRLLPPTAFWSSPSPVRRCSSSARRAFWTLPPPDPAEAQPWSPQRLACPARMQ
eukprot:TRINITY_DN4871_c0_g1_i1.p2 TRINITY_DN4871_c0_g1~~TRINITY_DN4871_c0_g1_i1.p2  ORF type:complete len:786 (+),score=153.71 TRINITY_DN4871_c0_g1_i1:75-2432(+)